VQQVAQDLGVRYVLEGSVRKSQSKLRITAQLIDAIKGHHVWADRWDRELKEVFAIQDEITMKILTAMQVKLTAKEQARIVAKGTNNIDAYLKVLEANEKVARFNQKNNVLARELAKEAIELDPQYAFAYTILGKTYMLEVWLGTSRSPKESIAQAVQLARSAIDLDESIGRARGLLGFLYTMTGQHEKGIIEAEKAVSLEPNSDLAHQYLGLALRFAGRPNDAIPVIKKAIRLNPFAPSTYVFNLGLSYLFSGRNAEAIAECKKATTREPNNLGAQLALTVAYALSGREKEARSTAEEVPRLNPKFSLEHFSRSLAYKNRADKKRYLDALRKAGLPETPPLPLPDKPSIAVLPFVNITGDPEQEYFSDGITEEIITALSKTSKLFVIARTSSFKYKGKKIDVRTLGRELGVGYVLEGSVRKTGDKVRITAQLINAQTNHHLWADRYDRELKDIFALQDEITIKILTALQVKLTEGEQVRIWGKKVENLDVYLKILELRSLWAEGTKESHIRHGQIAQEVIDMAPEWVGGYRNLAWHHWYLAKVGKSPRESMGKAFKLAKKVLHMDESDSSSHALVGQIYLLMRKYEEAIAAGERSVELDPNGAMVRGLLGMTLSYADRPDEAISHLTHAIRINPFAPYWYFYRLGQCYMQKGAYEKALKEYKKALQRAPNAFSIHAHLAALYVLMDRKEEGRAAAKKVFELYPKFSLDRISKTLTFKNKDFFRLFVVSMRKAGLE
jgi:TolB-like protein/Tfp pilus assembly protein PilF